MRLSVSPRRGASAFVAAGCAVLLSLSACSSGSSPSKSGESTAASFPTVQGAYGTKPVLTFPAGQPSPSLQVKVLSTGKGPVVASGDLLVADYLGQIWHGKVFDNSYDRKEPLATPIGVGQVIKGWDTALVGQHAGSRVLIVVPPAEGYGSAGSPQAGIKGTDTLAFVIDIVSSYSKADTGDKNAVVQKVNTAPVTVTGALGARPKITIAKGAALPKTVKATVLAKSKGAPAKPGFVIVQYEALYYNGTLADSTYVRGQPQGTGIGTAGQSSPFDKLVGVPIGSRVLITTPVQTQTGSATAVAIVADVVAQSGPAQPAH